MLPTARRYSLSAVYTQMNLRDTFVQAMLRPSPKLSLRSDLHRLDLLEPADRWYFGSGATQRRGTGFGYGTRISNGETSLATVLEAAADYTFNARWSVNGYVGWLSGGEIVERLFADRNLTFLYAENVLSW
jgi:hypothetical protein